MEKHTEYFELMESLRDAKPCGVCALAERSAKRHIDAFLYESVNDRDFRKKLMLTDGFCRRHSEMLLEFGDSLGTAIVYRAQIDKILKSLQGGKPGRSPLSVALKLFGAGGSSGYPAPAKCMECEVEDSAAQRCLETLVLWLEDEPMLKALETGSGLCSKHLFQALNIASEPKRRETLAKLHVPKFEALHAALSGLIRKNDYLAAGEKVEPAEADSWTKAVKLIQS